MVSVRAVAEALKISPTTLYKYQLDREIHAAEQRQSEDEKLIGKTAGKHDSTDVIRDLKTALEQECERIRISLPKSRLWRRMRPDWVSALRRCIDHFLNL